MKSLKVLDAPVALVTDRLTVVVPLTVPEVGLVMAALMPATPLVTVTLTWAVACWPVPSTPVTMIVCAPSATLAVFQGIEVGWGAEAAAVATVWPATVTV